MMKQLTAFAVLLSLIALGHGVPTEFDEAAQELHTSVIIPSLTKALGGNPIKEDDYTIYRSRVGLTMKDVKGVKGQDGSLDITATLKVAEIDAEGVTKFGDPNNDDDIKYKSFNVKLTSPLNFNVAVNLVVKKRTLGVDLIELTRSGQLGLQTKIANCKGLLGTLRITSADVDEQVCKDMEDNINKSLEMRFADKLESTLRDILSS